MKILIIESDEAFAGQLREAIAARGVQVEITPDGKDGLDRAHESRPDAIVLAVELGDKLTGGYAYCNKLKKDDALRDIPLVLISSQATPETFEQHRKLKTRAEEYLIKPFEPAELVEKLAAHVEMPPPDIEIDDLSDEGVQVEEMETFEFTAAGTEPDRGGDDAFALDRAFSSISGEASTVSVDTQAADSDELQLDELPGEAALPPPVRVSPGPARAALAPEPRPASPGPRYALTPGPAVAAAEAAMQIAELKGQVAELEARLETALRDLEELRQSDGDRVQRLESELARKDAAVKTAQGRADLAQAQARKLEATLTALKADAGRTAALEEELARLTEEQAGSGARTAALERDVVAERARADRLQQDLQRVRVDTDTEGDRLRGRIAELEGEAARNEDRAIKAYQKIKGDEKVKEKTKKALAIALQLLEEHAIDEDEVRTS